MQKGMRLNTNVDTSLIGIGATLFVKRLFDIVVSLALIIVALPFFAVIAIVSAISTGSSPIFVQPRMGRYNRPFNVLKFRTMCANAPSNVATCELANPEQYITRAGGIMRRLSIDELPQIFNIFMGQMSFVGPRPVVAAETDLVEMRTRNGACSVRPGLTGLSQVNGRDHVAHYEKATMDAFYASNVSILLDLRIIVQTVVYVLRSKDVHEGARPAGGADA